MRVIIDTNLPVSQALNHEVVAAQSPRLLYSATLGNAAGEFTNPNGVVALRYVKGANKFTIL